MAVETTSLKNLASNFPMPMPISIEIPWYLQGGFPDSHYKHEMEAIATLCHLQSPLKVFEFGTYHGFTTLVMALNTGQSARIYTLDLPQNWAPEQNPDWDKFNTGFAFHRKNHNYIDSHSAASKINRLYGDSLSFDFSSYTKSIDIVLVDANHQLKYLQKDTENAFQMSSSRGIILWHDYGTKWPDVTPFLDQLSEKKNIARIEGTNYAIFQST